MSRAVAINTMWYVYIIQAKDNTLYTGITIDVARRLQQHAAGVGAKYLRGKQPLQLVLSIEVSDRSTASQLEYKIKRLSRAQKIQLIAQGVTTPESMNCKLTGFKL